MDYQINANLLRKWINQQTQPPAQKARLAAVSVMPAGGGGFIEITLASGAIRISGQQDPDTVSAVIQALR